MNVILSPTALIQIFVFGSNLAGIHGLGSAKEAVLHHGAEYIKNVTARFGVIGKNGFGLQGNSFAIPTKDQFIQTVFAHIGLGRRQFVIQQAAFLFHY